MLQKGGLGGRQWMLATNDLHEAILGTQSYEKTVFVPFFMNQ